MSVENAGNTLPQSTAAQSLPSWPLPSQSSPLPPPLPSAEKRGCLASLKAAVKRLKHQCVALHYAYQDPRTGVLPRLAILLALAYALSPIDLIPDFIPVLGLLDDLIILPGLLMLAMWLIPAPVWEAAKQQAEYEPLRLHRAWGMAAFVFILWDAALLGAAWWGMGRFGGDALQQYKVWIVVGSGVLLAAGELGWMMAAHRKEARYAAALEGAGATPELTRALLASGGHTMPEHLEP